MKLSIACFTILFVLSCNSTKNDITGTWKCVEGDFLKNSIWTMYDNKIIIDFTSISYERIGGAIQKDVAGRKWGYGTYSKPYASTKTIQGNFTISGNVIQLNIDKNIYYFNIISINQNKITLFNENNGSITLLIR
jgi:hypothetical protein